MFGDEPTMSKAEVFAELRKRGATRAIVYFSGGGDEGGVNNIDLLNEQGEKIGTVEQFYTPGKWVDGKYVYDPVPEDKVSDHDLASALGAPVYAKYYTFAGEFYVDGELVWDVRDESAKMNGQESVQTWGSFAEEV